jgi:hypothetical protein
MGGRMGSKCFFSHGDSKNGFDLKVNDSILHQNGRHIILDLTVYEQRLTLVCFHQIYFVLHSSHRKIKS